MGVPIEGRSPYLDYRVVEIAYSLPVSFLIRHGWHKWILRKAIDGRLPQDVVWRRRKLGFPFPIERFLAASRQQVATLIVKASNPYVSERDLRDLALSDKAAPNWCENARRWRFISFLLWYELFVNRNVEIFNELRTTNQTSADYGFRPAFLQSCASEVIRAQLIARGRTYADL